jgi:hypothetical protein
MKRKNRPLVIDETVELEEKHVEVQEFRRIIHYFREIWRIYLQFNR